MQGFAQITVDDNSNVQSQSAKPTKIYGVPLNELLRRTNAAIFYLKSALKQS
jgi:hypothetical protein